MLPSSIGASSEARAAELATATVSWWNGSNGSAGGATYASPSGLGPLAQAAGRLLGAGGRQAFQSIAVSAYDRMFPGPANASTTPNAFGVRPPVRPHIAPMRDAWIAARILPTPNGYLRGASSYLRGS